MQIFTFFVMFTFYFFKNVTSTENDENFFVVSTKKPTTENLDVNDRLSRLEFYVEMRSTLNTLQESISELQKTKREYIEEVEAALEKKLHLYDQEVQSLNKQLTASAQNMQHQLAEMKKEIKEELTKTAKGAILENDQNTKKHLQRIRDEISDCREDSTTKSVLEDIKKQLTQCQANSVTEATRYKNCRDVQKKGNKSSGVYRIHPQTAPNDFVVWCDMATQGGGWTYVLNRFDGSQNFYLNWTDYKRGFGNVSTEHWLGLEHIHELTTDNKPTELLFELVDWDSKKVHATYTNFRIGGESEDYAIKSLGEYSGDAGDSFRGHAGVKFSTADRENDNHTTFNCAVHFKGAWWYYNCYHAHLTGVYLNKAATSSVENAIHWYKFHGYNYSLKKVRMMIRPRED